MKWLAFLLAILPTLSWGVVLYEEDFEDYSIGTPLTNTPKPGWVIGQASGLTVQSNWSSNVGRINGTGWTGAWYDGASFGDVTVSARFGGSARSNLWIRGGSWSGSLPGSGYHIQVESTTACYFDIWPAGARLASHTLSPAVNLSDFTISVVSIGTTHHVSVDGIYRFSVTNSTHTSGKVGVITFSSTTNFDNFLVDDGLAPSPTPTSTDTPTVTPTATETATPTSTPTATPTATPTDTPTASPTATPTDTPTASLTATPTATATSTATNTPTITPTPVCGPKGNQTPEAGGVYGMPMLTGNAYSLAGTRVNSFSVYTSAAGSTIQAVLYTNNNGRPGTRVARSITATATAGWNTLAVASGTTFNAGTYWITVQANNLTSRVWGRPGADLFVQRTPTTMGSPPLTPVGIVYPDKYTYSIYIDECTH